MPEGSVAYVAGNPDNKVAIVDLKILSVTGRIPTGKGLDELAWAVRKQSVPRDLNLQVFLVQDDRDG